MTGARTSGAVRQATDAAPGSRRLTALLYCQHLSGAGHFVRTFEVARALAERHDVHLVDGGWAVPRPPAPGVRLLALPRLVRDERGRLACAQPPGLPLDDAMRERRAALERAAERLRPDVVLVEHFPFSKWELEEEVLALIAAARRARRDVLVLCSLRDISPNGRFDGAADPAARARALLERHFAGLLVHGDPRFLRLADEQPWLVASSVPHWYTGYVIESRPAPSRRAPGAPPHVVVSSGGLDAPALLAAAGRAWELLRGRGRTGGRALLRFGARPGPREADGADAAAGAALGAASGADPAPFGVEFHDALATADLAVGRAGYNTVASILAARVRAVLVPDPRMRDQVVRARRLEALGLAAVLDPAALTDDVLAQAIEGALDRPAPRHEVDLGGAARTREIVEGLAGAALAPLPSGFHEGWASR